MQNKLTLNIAAAAVAGAVTLLPLLSHAGANEKMDKSANPEMAHKATNMSGTSTDRTVFSDRERFKPWSNEKDVIKAMLTPGQDKPFYAKTLRDNGYQITSINADEKDYAEYEIVKGGHSYEVQIDFDKAAKASKVEIDSNLWRADATKAAVRGERMEQTATYSPTNSRFSDRTRIKGWTGEKDKLEKALTLGQDKAAYATKLKSLGYQVTSTNESKSDYVEYEVVKGDNSYEVQIDMEAGKGKKIDVTSNMWESDATEKALSDHKKMAKAK